MSDRITVEIEVNGLARPVTAIADFETPEHGHQLGGWFLSQAWVRNETSGYLLVLDRSEFRYLFGSEALQVAEENIADYAAGRPCDLPDREEEVMA